MFFFILCSQAFLPWNASAQSWQWMKGSINGESHGLRIATDTGENVYAAGECWFNGSFGLYYYSPGFIGSVCLVKYDSVGNLHWMVLGDSSNCAGLATDLFGNEYLLAVYYGHTVNFGGHILVNPRPSLDSGSYFLAKINASGDVIWVKNIGAINCFETYPEEYGNCITTDACGNIYVECAFTNNIRIGTDSFTKVPCVPDIGSADILVAKYDSSGNVIWAKSFGGDWPNSPTGIAVTRSGYIYFAGDFKSDTLYCGSTFLTDTSELGLGNKVWSSFLIKLDNLGNTIWARDNTGSANCEVSALAVDQSENAYITGNYEYGSLDFGGTLYFGLYAFSPSPYMDVRGFLVKFDSSGTVAWGKTIQSYVFPLSAVTDPLQ